MASYCTPEEVFRRAPQVRFDQAPAATITDGIVAAGAMIDGRLSGMFSVPFNAITAVFPQGTPVPTLIKIIAANLAASWAITSIYSGQMGSEMDQAARLQVMGESWLEKIACGEMLLETVGSSQIYPDKAPPLRVNGPVMGPSLQYVDPLGFAGPRSPSAYGVYGGNNYGFGGLGGFGPGRNGWLP